MMRKLSAHNHLTVIANKSATVRKCNVNGTINETAAGDVIKQNESG